MSTPYGNLRIGDQERMQAMDTLGRALGEGRLTMDEFDQRCNQVAKAKTQNELRPVLADLPAVVGGGVVKQQPIDHGGQGADKLYSAREIMQARRSGQRMRFGAFSLGSIASFVSMGLFMEAGLPGLGVIALMLIPTLFILLYIMRVGPDSWYTPSLRELEKHRRQLVRQQQLELESAHAMELAQRKLERKAQFDQLTGDALDVARETVNRFKPKG